MTLAFAVAVTALEVIKIVYKFSVCHVRAGDLNDWLPLYFCSLFIYYAWVSAFGGTRLTPYGDAFVGAGALTGGLAFLVYPTTSVTMVPIWHFLSLHSMLFHSMMVLTGLYYLRAGLFVPSRRGFWRYSAAFGVFALPAIVINLIGAGRYNAMILHDPYRLPRPLAAVAAVSPALYTVVAVTAYLAVPYLVSLGVSALCFRSARRAGDAAEEPEDEKAKRPAV